MPAFCNARREALRKGRARPHHGSPARIAHHAGARHRNGMPANVHARRQDGRIARVTLRVAQKQVMLMFPPKAFLDAVGAQASRLFSGENPLPRAEVEAQLKGIVQGALSKLDVVSREEFDSQMIVLARTRARLEALEAKVAELEEKLAPPASE